MKKNNIFSICTLSLLTLCVCLLGSGCFTSYDGTYKFSKIEAYGLTYTAGESFMGVTIDADYMTVSLNEDETVTIDGVNVGTWDKVDRNNISIVSNDGESVTYYCDGKILKIVQGDVTIVLQKE